MMAGGSENFYHRLPGGKSPKSHYQLVTTRSLQLHVFSQLTFTTTNSKIGIIILPILEMTKIGSE